MTSSYANPCMIESARSTSPHLERRSAVAPRSQNTLYVEETPSNRIFPFHSFFDTHTVREQLTETTTTQNALSRSLSIPCSGSLDDKRVGEFDVQGIVMELEEERELDNDDAMDDGVWENTLLLLEESLRFAPSFDELRYDCSLLESSDEDRRGREALPEEAANSDSSSSSIGRFVTMLSHSRGQYAISRHLTAPKKK